MYNDVLMVARVYMKRMRLGERRGSFEEIAIRKCALVVYIYLLYSKYVEKKNARAKILY